MQIKVKDTRMHSIIGNKPHIGATIGEVSVVEAQLVLIHHKDILPEIGMIGSNKVHPLFMWTQAHIDGFKNLIEYQTTYYIQPILISLTEKIEKDEWFYWAGTTKQIQRSVYGSESGHPVFKVLALSKHFSSKQLQAIVDGKLKDGDKVLVECEVDKYDERNQYEDVPSGKYWEDEPIPKSPNKLYTNAKYYCIKLNSSNNIILHKSKEELYSRATLISFALHLQDTCELSEGDFYHNNQLVHMDKYFDEWYEKQKK